MKIFSRTLKADVDIEGYVNCEQNIVLTHKGISSFIDELDGVKYQYSPQVLSRDHSVVYCAMEWDKYNRNITEIGETCKETLEENFRFYPGTTATEIAFDRAAIKLLGLPSNTYSVLEFLKKAEISNHPGQSGQTAPSSEASMSPEENKGTDQGKMNVEDYPLDFGIFSGENSCTVKCAFELAKADPSVMANLKVYLTKNVATIRDQKERVGIIALVTYARKNNIALEDLIWDGEAELTAGM